MTNRYIDCFFYLFDRYNKMLPDSHFEKIEKGAIDHINPSAKPITTKDENVASKKVVEIKENALDKNIKTVSDDEDPEYDYYNDNDNEYDDDIDNDDLVTVTPKIVTNKMGKCLSYIPTFEEEELPINCMWCCCCCTE